MTDPIADMLTRMRNALSARHQKVDVPASNLKVEVARIMKDEGFISNYKVIGEGANRAIRIYLKYVSADGSWALADYLAFGGARANMGRLTLRQGEKIQPLVDTRAPLH